MEFTFHSLDEIREFIKFINADKDEVIRGETAQLNLEMDKLKTAVQNVKETAHGTTGSR